MAEDQDEFQKTEEPTQKKLEEAHKKGDVARSQEVRHWFMLVAATIALATTGPYSLGRIKDSLGAFIANSDNVLGQPAEVVAAVGSLIVTVALATALPIGFLIVGGLAGSFLQHRPVFSHEKMIPRFSKISPISGFKRLFSVHALMEFLKTIFKFSIVAAVAIAVVWPSKEILTQLMTISTFEAVSVINSYILKMLIGVTVVMTIIAAIDMGFQRFQQTKKLRMTKQEVKDEFKQLEGDPHVKARIRQIRMERARQRMMTAVPEADVVVTNPTHFAAALKYEHGNMQVPVLLAKGLDFIALKIREIAEEEGIPIVENPPLARALYDTVDIGEEIPPKHYKAVAEVIGFVLRQKGKLK